MAGNGSSGSGGLYSWAHSVRKVGKMCALIVRGLFWSNDSLGCRLSASKYLIVYGKTIEKIQKNLLSMF